MSEAKRRDKKGRVLFMGEAQDSTGRYVYRYRTPFGQRKAVYSWRLTNADPTPAGKRKDKSLREKEKEIENSPLEAYFVDHTTGIYPTAASGFPWNAAGMQVKGDPIADLVEDLAAEQKARVTYDNILRLSDDPDVNDVIKFLREREIIHFQRFGESLQQLRERLNQKNVYYMNPAFDK